MPAASLSCAATTPQPKQHVLTARAEADRSVLMEPSSWPQSTGTPWTVTWPWCESYATWQYDITADAKVALAVENTCASRQKGELTEAAVVAATI